MPCVPGLLWSLKAFGSGSRRVAKAAHDLALPGRVTRLAADLYPGAKTDKGDAFVIAEAD